MAQTKGKIQIRSADMPEEIQKDAVAIAQKFLLQPNANEKELSILIKKEFDKKYLPAWHCIVGKNFGSYVTHEANHFIYFSVDSVYVLLFKAG